MSLVQPLIEVIVLLVAVLVFGAIVIRGPRTYGYNPPPNPMPPKPKPTPAPPPKRYDPIEIRIIREIKSA